MRRADRLLQIIQIMRREKNPVTSSQMAEELEVSQRTLYRDMASLESVGVPIRGEAGMGYVLDEGYHLPPLMFTESELEAIMLGARMVDGRVDDAMSRAARDAVAKIETVLPKELRATLLETPLFAPLWVEQPVEMFELSELRAAIRAEREIAIEYTDLGGNHSNRIVWPFTIGLFASSRVLTAWCTMREDYRTFRTDNITRFEVLDTRYGKRRAVLLKDWRKRMAAMDGGSKKGGSARMTGVGL